MIAVTLISVAFPLAVWLYVSSKLAQTSFELDVNREKYSFFAFYDRYAAFYRHLSMVAVIAGMPCWWFGFNATACLFLAAVVYALAFQIVTLNFYEHYVHAVYQRAVNFVRPSPYTANKYSIVITLGLAPIVLFVCGLVVALVGGVRR